MKSIKLTKPEKPTRAKSSKVGAGTFTGNGTATKTIPKSDPNPNPNRCFIEDTYDGCYRDVTYALVQTRGWKQSLNYKKPNSNSLKKR